MRQALQAKVKLVTMATYDSAASYLCVNILQIYKNRLNWLYIEQMFCFNINIIITSLVPSCCTVIKRII